MLITIAVCAMAEVARPLRFLNLPFVLWLIVAPWLLAGATAGSTLNDVVAGLVVIGSSAAGPSSRRTWKERRASLRAMVSDARVWLSPRALSAR